MDFKAFKNYRLHLHKTLLGVDFGEKNLGLAIFTPGRDPYPLSCNTLRNCPRLGEEILRVAAREDAHWIIFGLPLLADGKEGRMAQQVRATAASLESQWEGGILFQDEYLSSHSARERLLYSSQLGFSTQAEDIHTESAKIVLEDFIRSEGVE